MDELERLEAELAGVEARLGDPEHAARTSSQVLNDERQYRNELRARVEALRQERASRPEPPSQGGLPSLGAGRWAPLSLHETARPEEPLPPFELAGPPPPEPDREAISKAIAEAVTHTGRVKPVVDAVRPWRSDPYVVRLAKAALHTLRAPNVARALELSDDLRLPSAQPTILAGVPWLDRATEFPDESDGLTKTQRQLLRLMRDIAPPGRPFVRLTEIAREVAGAGVTLELPAVEHTLLALGHPALRPFPLVEFQGLSGRLSTATHFTHARLTSVAVEVLEETFPLPLLLLNGAEGAGTTLPPFRPSEVLSALGAVVRSERDVEVHGHVTTLQRPDGALLLSGMRALRETGAAPLWFSARVGTESDTRSTGARLVVTRFPWPLSAGEVAARLRALQADGFLDGVTAIDDESSATDSRLVLTLEHVAFLGPVRAVLDVSQVFLIKLSGALVVDVNGKARQVDLADLLRAFVEYRKEVAVKRLDAALAHARLLAARAEAVCVALVLLEPVQEVLRAALDDAEAIAGLQRFMRPEHRAALGTLPLARSHGYEQGFTADQAKHLVGLRKLGHRRRDAAVQDWAAALSACEEAKARLSSRGAMLTLVERELAEARQRFPLERG